MAYQITDKDINEYREYLVREERAEGSIQKYIRDIGAFTRWLSGREAGKEVATAWKAYLLEKEYAPATINSMLSSLNGFFRHMGWTECQVKTFKIQRRMFREKEKELSKEEYVRLVKAANQSGNKRLELLLETICATGIRVSEVRYITVEALQKRRAEIHLKGKIRTVFLTNKLIKKLLRYAKKHKIRTGEIFVTKSGKGVSRRQIWQEMKNLCAKAEVEPTKVFPHNLRHLFARTFYQASHDVVQLADMLGHSNIATTRTYLISTGESHMRQLEELGLVA